ncbi:MAG: iron-containing alcohol dehydrogenase [Candidatus Hodarchaeales archaeon]|jgi:alcohol dehydrogenase class IV
MWTYRSVPKIVFGEDALEDIETLQGQKAIIISDRVLNRLNFVEKVEERLIDFNTEVLIDIPPEPSITDIENLAPALIDFEPDWIIALGGGSVLDAAKALWVRYENPELLLEEIAPFTEVITRKKARLLAIPTTSGTGSEVSWSIVLSDESGRKLEMASPAVIPDIAIVDPVFPMAMLPSLTADTGLDALANSIEAMVSEWRNPFSDAFALQSIPDIFHYLPQAYHNGLNVEARTKMHIAGTIAGLAFTNSHAGIAHSLAHALGAVFHMAHGRTVAVSLPYAIEFNQRLPGDAGGEEIVKRYATIGRLIGETGENDFEITSKLVARLRSLLSDIGEPASLKEINISSNKFTAELDRLVALANESTCTVVNPRIIGDEELENLFWCLYEGTPVTF